MRTCIDNDISNLSRRKPRNIVRLSVIVSRNKKFPAQVEQEIICRKCQAKQLRRYLFSSALVDQYGIETTITEGMIDRACNTNSYPG